MNIGTALVANSQAAVLVKPTVCAFDYPAQNAEAAAVWGTPARDEGVYPLLAQGQAVRIGIVSAVRYDEERLAARPTALSTDRWNGLHQGNELGDIVLIGAGDNGGKGNALAIRDYMVFTSRFAPVCRVGARLVPPKTARTLELSTTARDQSSWSAACSLASNISWMRCQTPSICQSRRRRQHVMPHPQPKSRGRYSHGMPVRRTNKIPMRALRLGMGGRPRVLGGFTQGRNGSIRVHSPSGNIARAIRCSLQPNGLSSHCSVYRHAIHET